MGGERTTYGDYGIGYRTFHGGKKMESVSCARRALLLLSRFVIAFDDQLTYSLPRFSLFVGQEFLFYYEKYSPDPASSSTTSEKQHPPRDWDPLVKQTYSVWVDTDKGRRKWHLTAYFTQATVDQLGTVDDIQGVGILNVPEGHFKSTRVKKGGSRAEEPISPPSKDSTPGRVFAPFLDAASGTSQRNSHSSQTVQMYQPYPSPYSSSYPLPPEQKSSAPVSVARFSQITPVPTAVPSNYSSGAESPVEPQQSSLRLAIPTTLYNQSQPLETHSVAPSIYNATRSPIHTSPHSPPWYPDYHQKSSEVFEHHAHHHPLRHYHSSSPKAGESPSSPYTLPQPPYLPLNYHSPSPIRPISSSNLAASPYSHTGPTPIVDSYGPSSSPVETPHPMYPAALAGPGELNYSSRPCTSHFREHVTYTGMTSVSPVSSGSGHSAYSMAEGGGGSHVQSIYEDIERDSDLGPDRGLAPLGVLKRPHPYRRHPGDDKTLKLLARHTTGSDLES
ncbi:hypothetical protein E1B28_000263 [Marasmius oreades]|uniref:Uncharacterized protein n=1 Tax=Marasmius oreades TaxID=181124 RepID=A0A9P7V136_9AGAR|nr:uncharacterized protein E1B28_000263 [Marasmius oreades]KAG7098302.1 hypothetical protein E1B28_000263 [Marasmius oreades]